ncbi:hypothetical protein ACWGKQ_35850 [Streptomyces sp. NPDC054770]
MSEIEMYELLLQGFRSVSAILNERHSTLIADPILAELAELASRDEESDGVRRALLELLDSPDFSADAEVAQYFAYRFKWDWLKGEIRQRYLESVSGVDHKRARHYQRMLEAFADDWEDKDLFPSLDIY